MAPSIAQLLPPLLAVLLSLACVVVIVVVTLRTIYLTNYGLYDSRARAGYAAVSTMIASGIAMFIASQIRRLWVRRINSQFHHTAQTERLSKLNGMWRTALGVGSMADMLRNLNIQASFLIAGLITTALVASFTPTLTTREDGNYSVQISTGEPYSDAECCFNRVNSSANPCVQLSAPYWNLKDGGQLWANPAGGTCPTRRAVAAMKGINAISPQDHAYTDWGVYVHSPAIGAPVAVFASIPGFGRNIADLVSRFNANVVNTTQCVPVMIKNPVSCRDGGTYNIGMTTYGQLTVTSSDGSCSTTNAALGTNPNENNMMAKGLCPYGEVGQATVVLAALGGYAGWLALSVGDEAFYNTTAASGVSGYLGPNTSTAYAVTCDVDVRDVYAFRKVTLSLQATDNQTFGWQLDAVDKSPCSPDTHYPPDMTGLLAAAAIAAWQPLLEYDGLDGWFDTINAASQDFSNPPFVRKRTTFAFANSKNGLEDALGLASAMVGAYMNSTRTTLTAQAVVAVTQIGSGHTWAVIFALPPLLAAIILIVQIWQIYFTSNMPHIPAEIEELVKLGPKPDAVPPNQVNPNETSPSSLQLREALRY